MTASFRLIKHSTNMPLFIQMCIISAGITTVGTGRYLPAPHPFGLSTQSMPSSHMMCQLSHTHCCNRLINASAQVMSCR